MSDDQSVPRNINYLYRRLNSLATSRLGPVSLEPGDSITIYGPNGGTLMVLAPEGVTVDRGGQQVDLMATLANAATAADIKAEREARVQGDTNLGGLIMSEIKAEREGRVQSDSNLSGLIVAEREGRVRSDTNLGNAIGNKASKSALAGAVSDINDSLAGITSRLRALESKVGNTVTPGSGGVPVPGTDPDPPRPNPW